MPQSHEVSTTLAVAGGSLSHVSITEEPTRYREGGTDLMGPRHV